jgi:hypothetical protein
VAAVEHRWAAAVEQRWLHDEVWQAVKQRRGAGVHRGLEDGGGDLGADAVLRPALLQGDEPVGLVDLSGQIISTGFLLESLRVLMNIRWVHKAHIEP